MTRHQLPFRPQHWNLTDFEVLGFASEEEARYWQNSSCGILCIGMALEKTRSVSNAELISDGQRIGAYTHELGWSHDGLVELAKRHGLDAYRSEELTTQELKRLLDSGAVIIVSIKWAFKPTKSFKEKIFPWVRRGGHLALVIGHDDVGFYVHHTSTIPEYNWEDRRVAYEDFQIGFTGRGIVLRP